MNWYYEFNKEQRGPVDGRELLATFQSGLLSETTLVWNENLSGWEPLATHLDAIRGEAGVIGASVEQLPEMAACAYSGKVMPRADMVPYGDKWIAPEHKDAFVQSLMEGDSRHQISQIGGVEYAGFWIRFLAKFIDGLILNVASLILMIPVFIFSGGSEGMTGPNSEDFITLLQFGFQISSVVIGYFYTSWMIWKYQATLGKMALGLKVIMANGSNISFLRSTGRYFAELLSGMICYIGYIIAGFDDEKRSLHDHICATRVVKK